jgi:hypothetical protein
MDRAIRDEPRYANGRNFLDRSRLGRAARHCDAADGASIDLCDPVALLTLRRVGFVKGSRLTLAAEQMLSEAVRKAFAA